MGNCCDSFIKIFLCLLNFVFAITGLALIALGAYVKIEAENYLDFLGNSYVTTPILFIIVGAIIFVIAFFGCCGTCSESSCMIYTYACLLIVVIIVEVGAGVAAYMLKDDLKQALSHNMKLAMDNYSKEGYGGVNKTWDFVQGELECCGVANATDWIDKFNLIPDSCCGEGNQVTASSAIPGYIMEDNEEGRTQTGQCSEDSETLFRVGCLSQLENLFVDNIVLIGAVALGIAVLQLVFITCACCIATNIYAEAKGELV